MEQRSRSGFRPLLLIPVLFGVTLISFMLVHAVPGEPTRTLLAGAASPDQIPEIRIRYGLDQPLLAQYVIFLKNLLQGDLGNSVIYKAPVLSVLFDRLPATLVLIILSTALSFALAVGLATTAALSAGHLIDRLIRRYATVGLGVPAFWLGLQLIILFGMTLHVLPQSGFGGHAIERLRHIMLPTLAIALTMAPTLIGELRARLLGELVSDHAAAARAQGLPERRIFLRHAFRNALLPAIIRLGRQAGWLLGTIILVEQAFALPGLGSLFVGAVLGHDYLVLQAITLFFAVVVVAVDFLVDMLAASQPLVQA
jgi:peptide/nickel transport system permease protein